MSEINILDKIEWAIQTIRDQLLFGIDEFGAAKVREIRAKGVLLDCKEEITRLKKALEIANEAIGFYGNKGNWFYDYGMYQNEFKSIAEEDSELFDIDGMLIPKHYGGKRAREAQKQIKEVMEDLK